MTETSVSVSVVCHTPEQIRRVSRDFYRVCSDLAVSGFQCSLSAVPLDENDDDGDE